MIKYKTLNNEISDKNNTFIHEFFLSKLEFVSQSIISPGYVSSTWTKSSSPYIVTDALRGSLNIEKRY